jgi:hypothetical protein
MMTMHWLTDSVWGQNVALTNAFLIVFYAFFWLIRMFGWWRRGRQPLLRGPEWFFNVHVRPGFYEGEGKKLLHRYWLRMFAVSLSDVPVVIAILFSGRLDLLMPVMTPVMLAVALGIHLNHSYSVESAQRKAQRFAVAEDAEPAASVMLSLKPRRLRDYTSAKFEWTLGIVSAFTLVLLLRYYLAAPSVHSLAWVFSVPVMMLYIQTGYLIAKRIIVDWRSPVPRTQTAEHIEVREQTRKFYLRVCDWSRAAAVASLPFWLVDIWVSPAKASRLMEIWLGLYIAFSAVATVWVEWKRKRLLNMQLRTRPVRMPDLLRESEMAKWPVCYEPSAPMLVLKGANGFSLNMANSMAIAATVYLAGFITLLALLPKQ